MKKKFFAALAIFFAASLAAFSAAGCSAVNGRDGADGKDANIYDIWQETIVQTNNPSLTFEEFLHEYLSYEASELDTGAILKASVNRSLLSAVAIITSFNEYAGSSRYGAVYNTVSYYGSGVIIDVDREAGDMTVVTNCHVVYSADANIYHGAELTSSNGFAKDIRLWLFGTDYPNSGYVNAEIVGASKNYDIAVLHVSGSEEVKRSKAIPAVWDESEESDVGDIVYTVGNADGEDIAASVGYISKSSENITVNLGSDTSPEMHTFRVMRTDAAINGGNSGGGLYNKEGKLVGIVNAKTISDEVDNMGYALCASTTKRVVNRLIEDADGTMGIDSVNTGFSYDVTDSYSAGLDNDGNARIKEIVTVVATSKAVGLKAGDVLTKVSVERDGVKIDGADILCKHNLDDVLICVRPKDKVTFTYMRDGEEGVSSMTYTADYFRRLS